jgi:hypothetical protein
MVSLRGAVAIFLGTALIGVGLITLGYSIQGGTDHPVCLRATTQDSTPVQVACDYRDGAWHPQGPPVHLPPCDDSAPGREVTGTCWLADDDGVSVWPTPYATVPLYVLEPSQAR